jgi:DNA-binding FadR family transcriptional regulator
MVYRTVEAYVEVEVDLFEWDDEELIAELRDRGWFVSKVDVDIENVEKFQREDLDLLMDLVDASDNPLYTKSTLREKLLEARFPMD